FNEPNTLTDCLFFLILIPRTHTSTLFPYTTLFRSPKVCDYQYRHMNEWGKAMYVTPGVIVDGREVTGNNLVDINLGIRILLGSSDRKSTRLNSSHVAISYAVFCLKKKKKKMTVHE